MSATIERITATSSICSPTCENSSLTSMPLAPYFWNLNGEGNAAPVLRSVIRLPVGSSLPAYFASAGLGSKVSTCEGPPLANKWITRLARGRKCGSPRRCSSRTAGSACAAVSATANCAKANDPIPRPLRTSISRRVGRETRASHSARFLSSVDIAELVGQQQGLRQ